MVLFLSIVALILSLVGNILVNYKNKTGFIIWILSNIFWIIINFLSEVNYPQVLMYLIYTTLNVQGLMLWKKKKKKEECGENE